MRPATPKSKMVNLVMTLLVVLPGVAGQLVWCIGEDGHLEMEMMSQKGCYDCVAADNHAEVSLELSHQDDHCGRCLDIPVTFPGKQVFVEKSLIWLVVTPCFPNTPVQSQSVCSTSWHYVTKAPPPIGLSMVKTTHLLI